MKRQVVNLVFQRGLSGRRVPWRVKDPLPPSTALTERQETAPVAQWTEVLDKSSGQVYYWNKATGNAMIFVVVLTSPS